MKPNCPLISSLTMLVLLVLAAAGCASNSGTDGDVDTDRTDIERDLKDQDDTIVGEDELSEQDELVCSDAESSPCPGITGLLCDAESVRVVYCETTTDACGTETCSCYIERTCQQGCVYDPTGPGGTGISYCFEDKQTDGDETEDVENPDDETLEEKDVVNDSEDAVSEDPEGGDAVDRPCAPCGPYTHCDHVTGLCVSECSTAGDCCLADPTCRNEAWYICSSEGRCLDNKPEGDTDKETEPEISGCVDDDYCEDGYVCNTINGLCDPACASDDECILSGRGTNCDDGGHCYTYMPDGDNTDFEQQAPGSISGVVQIDAAYLPADLHPTVRVVAYDEIPAQGVAPVGLAGAVETETTGTYHYTIYGLPTADYYVRLQVVSGESVLYETDYVYNPVPVNVETGGSAMQPRDKDINLGVDCSGCGSVSGTLFVATELKNKIIEVGVTLRADLAYAPAYAELGTPDPITGGVPYTLVGIPQDSSRQLYLFARARANQGSADAIVIYRSRLFINPLYGGQLNYSGLTMNLGFVDHNLGIVGGVMRFPVGTAGHLAEVMLTDASTSSEIARLDGLTIPASRQLSFQWTDLPSGFYRLDAAVRPSADSAASITDEYPGGLIGIVEGNPEWVDWGSLEWNVQNRTDRLALQGRYLVSDLERAKPAIVLLYPAIPNREAGGVPLAEIELPPALPGDNSGDPPRQVLFRFPGLPEGDYSLYALVDVQQDGDPDNDVVHRVDRVTTLSYNGGSIYSEIAHDRAGAELAAIVLTVNYSAALAAAPLYLGIFPDDQPLDYRATPLWRWPILRRDAGAQTATVYIPNLSGNYYLQVSADTGVAGDVRDDILGYHREVIFLPAPEVRPVSIYLGTPHPTLGEISGTIYASEAIAASGLTMRCMGHDEARGEARYNGVIYGYDAATSTFKFKLSALPNAARVRVGVWIDFNDDMVELSTIPFREEMEWPLTNPYTINVANTSTRVYSDVVIHAGTPDGVNGSISGRVTMPEGMLSVSINVVILDFYFTGGAEPIPYFHRVAGPADESDNSLLFEYVGHLPSGNYWVYLAVLCGEHPVYPDDILLIDDLATQGPVVIDTNDPLKTHAKGLDLTLTAEQITCPAATMSSGPSQMMLIPLSTYR